jgi:hypothetical protein
VAIGLRTDGVNHGCNLFAKLQQPIKHWSSLKDCTDTVDVISQFESFRGIGCLELVSLHCVRLNTTPPERSDLPDAVFHHMLTDECLGTGAPLCASLCSTLLRSSPSMMVNLELSVLDTIIGVARQNTLQLALCCVGIAYNPGDSISVLRSLLTQYRNSSSVNVQAPLGSQR